MSEILYKIFSTFPFQKTLKKAPFPLNRLKMVNRVLKEKSDEAWLHTKLCFTTNLIQFPKGYCQINNLKWLLL